jgi:hypothetical protein
MTSFLTRLTGAALLNAAVYEEIEADRSATPQALMIVLFSSFAAGLGGLGLARANPTALVGIGLLALAGWMAWALLTLQIGLRVFPSAATQANFGQMLRTLGFASAPGILRVFGAMPGATATVFAVTAVWMLIAMIVAVRQALDYTSTARAVAVCTLGFVLAGGMAMIVGMFCSPAVY